MQIETKIFTQVDELGMRLAQISDLQKRSDAIKANLKELGADGLLQKKSVKGKDVQFMEGALFSATYVESNSTIFDRKKFDEVYGEDAFKSVSKISATFKILVTSR
jgi:hypothetical protein